MSNMSKLAGGQYILVLGALPLPRLTSQYGEHTVLPTNKMNICYVIQLYTHLIKLMSFPQVMGPVSSLSIFSPVHPTSSSDRSNNRCIQTCFGQDCCVLGSLKPLIPFPLGPFPFSIGPTHTHTVLGVVWTDQIFYGCL